MTKLCKFNCFSKLLLRFVILLVWIFFNKASCDLIFNLFSLKSMYKLHLISLAAYLLNKNSLIMSYILALKAF